MLHALFVQGETEVVIERYSLRTGAARAASEPLGLPLVLEVNAPIVLEAARHRGLQQVEQALERERLAFASADAVTVVSEGLAAYVTSVAPGVPVVRVPNGADPAAPDARKHPDLRFPPGSLVIGFVGSMKAWHGVHDLVSAFVLIMDDHPEMHLVLIGEGPERPALEARIAGGNLGDRVHLMGPYRHDQIPGLLASFDVGVAPYVPTPDFYFSPIKVAEYIAAGLPVVYPRIADLADLVTNAGLGYRAGDVGELAAALSRLASDGDLRRRLAETAGSRRAERSWARVAEETEALLRDICSSRGSSRAPQRASQPGLARRDR